MLTCLHVYRGILTGKLKRGVKPTEGRAAWATKIPSLSDLSDRTFDIIDVAQDIGKQKGAIILYVWSRIGVLWCKVCVLMCNIVVLWCITGVLWRNIGVLL